MDLTLCPLEFGFRRGIQRLGNAYTTPQFPSVCIDALLGDRHFILLTVFWPFSLLAIPNIITSLGYIFLMTSLPDIPYLFSHLFHNIPGKERFLYSIFTIQTDPRNNLIPECISITWPSHSHEPISIHERLGSFYTPELFNTAAVRHESNYSRRSLPVRLLYSVPPGSKFDGWDAWDSSGRGITHDRR